MINISSSNSFFFFKSPLLYLHNPNYPIHKYRKYNASIYYNSIIQSSINNVDHHDNDQHKDQIGHNFYYHHHHHHHHWCALYRDNWNCVGDRYENILNKTMPFDSRYTIDKLKPGSRVFIEGNHPVFIQLILTWICETSILYNHHQSNDYYNYHKHNYSYETVNDNYNYQHYNDHHHNNNNYHSDDNGNIGIKFDTNNNWTDYYNQNHHRQYQQYHDNIDSNNNDIIQVWKVNGKKHHSVLIYLCYLDIAVFLFDLNNNTKHFYNSEQVMQCKYNINLWRCW